jgi:putative FmdB family regulatory protein
VRDAHVAQLTGAHELPTYDYQCRSCGVITEVVHSMLEDGPTTCERCGGDLRRVVHAAGIIFRGSGFYKTDSRSSSSASVAGASRPAPTPPTDGKKEASGTDSGSGGGGSTAPSSSTESTTKGAD